MTPIKTNIIIAVLCCLIWAIVYISIELFNRFRPERKKDIIQDKKDPPTTKKTLIACQDCGEEISKRADTCPHCGCPTKYGKAIALKKKIRKRGNTQGFGCLLIILAVILGLTVVGLPVAIVIGIFGVILLLAGFVPVF